VGEVKEKDAIEAHTATFLRAGNLYTWVKLKLLYQEIFFKPIAGWRGLVKAESTS